MRISFLNFQTLSFFLRYAAIGILPLSPLFRKTVFTLFSPSTQTSLCSFLSALHALNHGNG